MRSTPVPVLTQLPCGFSIMRCQRCGELTFADEICLSEHEATACPSRAEIERAELFSSCGLR